MDSQLIQFDKDMQSSHQDLFLRVRQILLDFGNVEEMKKARITTYADDSGGIYHVRTTKSGVDVGFLKGAFIPDIYGLLQGNTKKMRVMSISREQSLNEEALKHYIDESRKLNTKPNSQIMAHESRNTPPVPVRREGAVN